MATARRLYELLRGQHLPVTDGSAQASEPPQLDVYFDQAAPGVEDWKSVHEPYLKRSRAMLVICTPGSKLVEGDRDWVHKEIDWWLGNRQMAPILVDPLGEGARYIPDAIEKRWHDAQRIRIIENEWAKFDPAELKSANERVSAQIMGAIVPSGRNFYRQEFEAEQKRTAELHAALDRQRATSRRLVWAIGGMAVVVLFAIAAVVYAFLQTQEAHRQTDAADQARKDAVLALNRLRTSDLRDEVLTAQQLLASGNFVQAIEAAAALRTEVANPRSPIADQAAAVDIVIVEAANDLVVPAVCNGPREMASVQFSDTASSVVAALADDSMIRWTLPACGDSAPVYQHEDRIAGMAWSPAGDLASAAWDRMVRIQSTTGSAVARLASGHGRIIRVQYPASGPLEVLTNGGDVIAVAPGTAPDTLDETPMPMPEKTAARDLLHGIAFLDDGGKAAFYDPLSKRLTGPFDLDAETTVLRSAAPDGQHFVVVEKDGSAWLLGQDRAATTLGTQGGDPVGLSISPDGRTAVTHTDNDIAFYRLDGPPAQHPYHLFSGKTETALAVSPDLFLASGEDGTVELVDAARGSPVWQVKGDQYSAATVTLSPHGDYVAIAQPDGGLGVRRLLTTADDAMTYYCTVLTKASTTPSKACPAPAAQ
ncbi:MAG TPA: hypothetical protein VHZ56_03530 [Devosia sp.]|nr:hypothetical protein [Devosia sp.]